MGVGRAITLLSLILVSVVVATSGLFWESEDMTCHPQARLVGWGEVAASRALVCASFIEVDGVSYGAWYDESGCVEVDEPFLGKFIAVSEGAVARSIEGVSRHVALALAFPNPREHGAGCVGWHVWHGWELTREEERAFQVMICRVVPQAKPDPESCIDSSASTAV